MDLTKDTRVSAVYRIKLRYVKEKPRYGQTACHVTKTTCHVPGVS